MHPLMTAANPPIMIEKTAWKLPEVLPAERSMALIARDR